MTLMIGRTSEGFHHMVVHCLAGMNPRKYIMGMWVYLPLEAAMEATGLEEVDAYVLLRNNTISQYIDTRQILDMCMAEDERPGAQVKLKWWD